MGEKFVAVLHIYRARAIFMVFCVCKDPESESCKMETGVDGPIFTQKRIYKALWDNGIHTLKDRRIILWQLFIFMEL